MDNNAFQETPLFKKVVYLPATSYQNLTIMEKTELSLHKEMLDDWFKSYKYNNKLKENWENISIGLENDGFLLRLKKRGL